VFLVVQHRCGPQWKPGAALSDQPRFEEHAAFMDGLVDAGFIVLAGPLGDEYRVVYAIDADSENEIRETLAADPWAETHLVIDAIEPWTIRLSGTGRSRRP
jgi:uncharacterized protein YciI